MTVSVTFGVCCSKSCLYSTVTVRSFDFVFLDSSQAVADDPEAAAASAGPSWTVPRNGDGQVVVVHPPGRGRETEAVTTVTATYGMLCSAPKKGGKADALMASSPATAVARPPLVGASPSARRSRSSAVNPVPAAAAATDSEASTVATRGSGRAHLAPLSVAPSPMSSLRGAGLGATPGAGHAVELTTPIPLSDGRRRLPALHDEGVYTVLQSPKAARPVSAHKRRSQEEMAVAATPRVMRKSAAM